MIDKTGILLTEKEVADMFRLSVAGLRAQRRRGDLPGALGIKIGKFIRYRVGDVAAFLERAPKAR